MLYNSNIIIVKQSRARQEHVICPIKVEDAKPGKWLRRAATRFEDSPDFGAPVAPIRGCILSTCCSPLLTDFGRIYFACVCQIVDCVEGRYGFAGVD